MTLLARTIEVAKRAASLTGSDYAVATDHNDIANYARSLGAPAILTDPDLPSGSDRCLAAVQGLGSNPDLIINLQGDAPFTPPEYLVSIIGAARTLNADLFTMGVPLRWNELDQLRNQKQSAPFSGTTCVRSVDGRALWFSKNIIPALRHEEALRKDSEVSPIIRHVGIYGYRLSALRHYVDIPPSPYEKLEGLEQLRAIEAGMYVHLLLAAAPRISISGIDTPADVLRAEALINLTGDPHYTGIYI